MWVRCWAQLDGEVDELFIEGAYVRRHRTSLKTNFYPAVVYDRIQMREDRSSPRPTVSHRTGPVNPGCPRGIWLGRRVLAVLTKCVVDVIATVIGVLF